MSDSDTVDSIDENDRELEPSLVYFLNKLTFKGDRGNTIYNFNMDIVNGPAQAKVQAVPLLDIRSNSLSSEMRNIACCYTQALVSIVYEIFAPFS